MIQCDIHGANGLAFSADRRWMYTSDTPNAVIYRTPLDEQGEPVIGAAVLIEGTTTGSVTDVNGNFVLSVPSKDAVLVVSYIGMATGKVKVQPKLTITLKSE